jgi:hypothetical protein
MICHQTIFGDSCVVFGFVMGFLFMGAIYAAFLLGYEVGYTSSSIDREGK